MLDLKKKNGKIADFGLQFSFNVVLLKGKSGRDVLVCAASSSFFLVNLEFIISNYAPTARAKRGTPKSHRTRKVPFLMPVTSEAAFTDLRKMESKVNSSATTGN